MTNNDTCQTYQLVNLVIIFFKRFLISEINFCIYYFCSSSPESLATWKNSMHSCQTKYTGNNISVSGVGLLALLAYVLVWMNAMLEGEDRHPRGLLSVLLNEQPFLLSGGHQLTPSTLQGPPTKQSRCSIRCLPARLTQGATTDIQLRF